MVNAGVKGVGSSMACDDQLIDALLGGPFNTLRQDLLDCICRVVIPFVFVKVRSLCPIQ